MKTLLIAAAAFVVAATGANAVNLVTNGGFETTTNGPGQFDNNTTAPGWTSAGYNFIFAPGTADTTGSNGQYGNLTLWGPNDGSANGLPAASPDGGNFVGADGAYLVAPIQQTITGLVAGQKYTVGFDWAGAQQHGYDSPTTEQWVVSLGGDTQQTAVVDNVGHGFTGWQHETFTYTATGTSEVLSFLAVGTPGGQPPFSLLDGVTLSASAPEPATWAMMLIGVGGMGAVARRRRGAAIIA